MLYQKISQYFIVNYYASDYKINFKEQYKF